MEHMHDDDPYIQILAHASHHNFAPNFHCLEKEGEDDAAVIKLGPIIGAIKDHTIFSALIASLCYGPSSSMAAFNNVPIILFLLLA